MFLTLILHNRGWDHIYNVILCSLSLDLFNDTKCELKPIHSCNFQWENSNKKPLKTQAIFINSSELQNSTIFIKNSRIFVQNSIFRKQNNPMLPEKQPKNNPALTVVCETDLPRSSPIFNVTLDLGCHQIGWASIILQVCHSII